MRDSPSNLMSNKIIMQRIWRGWVVPYLPRLIGALSLMALVAATASAYPLLTKYIFNALADGRAAEIIWVAPPVIIVFALVKGLALFAQTVMWGPLDLLISLFLWIECGLSGVCSISFLFHKEMAFFQKTSICLDNFINILMY